jgi:hypothetical protein
MHADISFALGRWVAPLLRVGLDSGGTAVWEQWQPSFCDPGRAPGIGWWYERDHATLSDFLKLLITAFPDPARRERLWMQMVLAISATNAPGLIEQRIMVGFSGIEHMMWQNLVLTNLRTESTSSAGVPRFSAASPSARTTSRSTPRDGSCSARTATGPSASRSALTTNRSTST